MNPVSLITIEHTGLTVDKAFVCRYDVYAKKMGMPNVPNGDKLFGFVRIVEGCMKNDVSEEYKKICLERMRNLLACKKMRLVDLPDDWNKMRFTLFTEIKDPLIMYKYNKKMQTTKIDLSIENLLPLVNLVDITTMRNRVAHNWSSNSITNPYKVFTVFTTRWKEGDTTMMAVDLYYSSLNFEVKKLKSMLELMISKYSSTYL